MAEQKIFLGRGNYFFHFWATMITQAMLHDELKREDHLICILQGWELDWKVENQDFKAAYGLFVNQRAPLGYSYIFFFFPPVSW